MSVDPNMRRGSLPQIVVPVPCHAEWNAMMAIERDGSVRFCDSCAKPVYDSRAMTRTQLHTLIRLRYLKATLDELDSP